VGAEALGFIGEEFDECEGVFGWGLGDGGFVGGAVAGGHQVEDQGEPGNVGDEVVEVGGQKGIGLGLGIGVEAVVGGDEDFVGDGVEGEGSFVGAVTVNVFGDGEEVRNGFVPGFAELGGEERGGDGRAGGRGLGEEEIGQGIGGFEE